jgi:hypothetical protein
VVQEVAGSSPVTHPMPRHPAARLPGDAVLAFPGAAQWGATAGAASSIGRAAGS